MSSQQPGYLNCLLKNTHVKMTSEAEDAWAQLVSVTDIESSPIPLVKEKYTIGRGVDCDVSLSENKLVSTRHCYIEKDEDGKIWLNDTSTNGTLLNLNTKLSKGDKRELQHGDEFYIVYKKNDAEKNVGYMYQDLQELQREEEATQEYSSDIADATLVDDEVNMVDSSPERCGQKRPADDETDFQPENKKQRKDTEKSEIKPEKSDSFGKLKKDQDKPIVKETKDMEEMIKESKDSAEKGKASSSGENKDKTTGAATKGSDEIEEALLCIICQELLHDCISLQPCMHSFCSGCYSEWMDRSNECPSCRMKVERINKNHIVNNLIEAYLKEHPDKKRSEEDLKELDAKNKITRDMLYPGKKKEGDYTDSSEYEDS
ncbi:hypothetical protein KUTeg_009459 [Tegillarca granosa]|uniref:E3 ubiquitin-protein ligase CHFR n=1 Tax=Tegillarca granosa TaxID=220873 RepID=A0ABQ9F798_TEGGR|nr:hypothetical protein KUTeg_009459 [Tegillarca granosa]